MLEILLTVFKYTGMFLTGIFGVFGLMVKFKDDQNKVTKAGKIALAMIIVSSLIAIGSQTLELIITSNQREKAAEERADAAKKQAEETLAAVKRTEQTISEIRRGLYPLNDVRVRYWISVPTDHVRLKDYRVRFEKELDKVVGFLNKGQRIPGITGWSADPGRNVLSFSFDSSSALAPHRADEQLAYTILGYADLELQFYVRPIKPADHPAVTGELRSIPDLTLPVHSGLDPRGDSGEHGVEYTIGSKQFRLQAFSVKSDPAYWKSNGKIVGIPDLNGCQLFVRLPSMTGSGDDTIDKYIPEIRKRFALDTLSLSIAGGQEFWFPENSFTRHVDKHGLPLYEIKLDDLTKFRR